jgi:hypothetical protein
MGGGVAAVKVTIRGFTLLRVGTPALRVRSKPRRQRCSILPLACHHLDQFGPEAVKVTIRGFALLRVGTPAVRQESIR